MKYPCSKTIDIYLGWLFHYMEIEKLTYKTATSKAKRKALSQIKAEIKQQKR